MASVIYRYWRQGKLIPIDEEEAINLSAELELSENPSAMIQFEDDEPAL